MTFEENQERFYNTILELANQIKSNAESIKSEDVALTQETLAPYTNLFDISALATLDSIGGILMKKLGLSEQDIDKRHASIE